MEAALLDDADRPQLDLLFARAPSGETFLKRQYAAFPFHITQAFRFDARPEGMASVVLQSLGAGLLQGDRVAMAVTADAGAAAHVTTQGSTVVHAMTGAGAAQRARLVVRPGALLEYLPRPAILFPAADLATRLEIELHDGATVMWCDAYLAHDPEDGGGRFAHLASETVLADGAGRTLALDRFEIDGGALDEAGVMAGHAVHAGIGLAGEGADDGLLAVWREVLKDRDGVFGGVSALPNDAGLFCRLLARDGVALRGATDALWRTMRRHLFDAEPGARP